MERLKKT